MCRWGLCSEFPLQIGLRGLDAAAVQPWPSHGGHEEIQRQCNAEHVLPQEPMSFTVVCKPGRVNAVLTPPGRAYSLPARSQGHLMLRRQGREGKRKEDNGAESPLWRVLSARV